jgi:hypothetical protein
MDDRDSRHRPLCGTHPLYPAGAVAGLSHRRHQGHGCRPATQPRQKRDGGVIFNFLAKHEKDCEHKGEKFVIYHGERQPISDALACAGTNAPLKEFLALLKQGEPSDIDILKGSNNVLHSLVAHSGIKAAIWIARHSKDLGINLDVQDKFRRSDNNKSYIHEQWIKAMGMDDQIDRFKWGRGKYLKNTALILAVKKGWDHRSDEASPTDPTMGALIIALLEHGADPNIQDGCGNTALHIAMLQRDYRVIKFLLKHGAKLDSKNNGGLKPEDLLTVRYEDIDPFLYYQTGGDTNCYIHTLPGKRNWETFFLRETQGVIKEHKNLLARRNAKNISLPKNLGKN